MFTKKSELGAMMGVESPEREKTLRCPHFV